MKLLSGLVACVFALWLGSGAALAERLTVFAAASLKTALDEVAQGFEAETGHALSLSYAGSSVLARQIVLGAPADVFLSANVAWMDHVEEAGRIVPGTRVDLLGNRLALVGHGARPAQGTAPLSPAFDLAAALGGGRLAMALTQAVPAGIYGKAALTHLGLWQAVAPNVVQADNVRAALKLVALGEAPLGVVYATDALAEPGVHLVGLFPEESHPPIRYPLAALREGAAAEALLAYLQGEAAAGVFERHGFAVLAREPG